MAELVLGIGTSHTPMLNASAEDWPRFIDRDAVRDFLDKEGQPTTYEELLHRAEPHVAAELTPERFAARHAEAQAGVDRLKEALKHAELDAVIVVGDDHKELYQDDNMPALVVYYGKAIRNMPLNGFSGPEWSRRATARYYEEKAPKDYPVASDLALHLINSLIDREFDPVASDRLPDGKGEGHAFAFVRKRLMEDPELPVVPEPPGRPGPPGPPLLPEIAAAMSAAMAATLAAVSAGRGLAAAPPSRAITSRVRSSRSGSSPTCASKVARMRSCSACGVPPERVRSAIRA